MAAGDKIDTVPLFRDYIKRQLGHPVLCVELADEQITELIRDTIDIFQRYMYSEGTYKDYMIIERLGWCWWISRWTWSWSRYDISKL